MFNTSIIEREKDFNLQKKKIEEKPTMITMATTEKLEFDIIKKLMTMTAATTKGMEEFNVINKTMTTLATKKK